jgi:hypothetical protein
MLYKIVMILALGVAVTAGVFNEIKVNAHIQEELRLDQVADDKKKEEDAAHNKADQDLNRYRDLRERKDRELTASKQEDQDRAADVVQTQSAERAGQDAMNSAEQERDVTKQSNQDFEDLSMELVEIKRIRTKLPKVERELTTAKKEREIVTNDNQRMRTQIVKLAPAEKKPLMPHGLRGKIVSVDTKYQYVVLDIGTHHGVLTKGELMISRDGSLLGKVKVTRVEDDYSIANVLQDWKADEPLEGDVVIYGGL